MSSPGHKKLRGLILRHVAYGDADLYLHVLNEDGLTSCFAKGAKRQRSPLLGITQIYSLVELELFQGRKTLSLDGGSVVYPFSALQRDPLNLAAAGHGADISLEILRDESHASWLYPLLIYYFFAIDAGEKPLEQLISTFGYRFLCEAGFAPLLEQEVDSGDSIDETKIATGKYVYSRPRGALVLRDQAAPYGRIEMSTSLWQVLRYLKTAPVTQLFNTTMNESLIQQLWFFVNPILEDQMEQPLRQLQLFNELKALEREAWALQKNKRNKDD